MSVQNEPDERDLRYVRFLINRKNRSTDARTVEELNDENIGSPAALYRQMADDGYLVCPECGALRPDDEHRRQHVARKRQARRGGGDAVQVPLSKGVALLKEAAAELERKNIRVEAGRFVTEHSLYGVRDKDVLTEGAEGEAVRVYWRENLSPESWRALCERHGLDPDDPLLGQVMEPTDVQRREGGSPAPPEYLAALVANYVLTGGDVEELLVAIHPDPDRVNRAALYKNDPKRPGPIPGLKQYAEQVATVVCGGKVSPGRPGPKVSKYEHRAASYVRERRGQGATEEEILAELREGGIWPLPIPLTLKEVKRLGGLELN